MYLQRTSYDPRHSYGNWLSVITDASFRWLSGSIYRASCNNFLDKKNTRGSWTQPELYSPRHKTEPRPLLPLSLSRPSFFFSSGCLPMVCRRHGMHTTSIFTPEETKFQCISLETGEGERDNVCGFLKIYIFLCQNNWTVKKDLCYINKRQYKIFLHRAAVFLHSGLLIVLVIMFPIGIG